MLTACELLDVLPEDYPQRAKVMDYFRAHVRGVTALQSGEGLWHQLLDRNDSYLETSATAIYVYCLAHAINKGWIDAIAYGPVTHLDGMPWPVRSMRKVRWKHLCGTGMAFDPAFLLLSSGQCICGAWIRTGALGRCGNDSFAQHPTSSDE